MKLIPTWLADVWRHYREGVVTSQQYFDNVLHLDVATRIGEE
jgi:hypothetical protein